MAEIYINFHSLLTRCSRDDIETDIEDEILRGRGYISGSGFALDGSGSNIDIDFGDDSPEAVEEFVEQVVALLQRWQVPEDTHVRVIYPGVDFARHVYGAPDAGGVSTERELGDVEVDMTPDTSADSARSATPSPGVEAGDVFRVPIRDGLFAAVRVVRVDPGSDHPYLLAASSWFGSTSPSLSDPALQAPLTLSQIGAIRPYAVWVQGQPPASFTKLGSVPLSSAEQALSSSMYSNWITFLQPILPQWEWEQRRRGS